MRVAFLAPDVDLGGYTGDVWHVKDLVVALGHLGCTVDLYVANASDWQPPGPIRVESLPRGHTLRAVRMLARRYRQTKPDIVYERRFSPKLSAALGFFLDRPFVVEANGIADEEMAIQGRPDRSPTALRALRSAVRGWLYRRSAGVVAVTDGIREVLIERYRISPDKIWVVPNGVDLNRFRPHPRQEAREALGLPSGELLVIFVGNLVAWQGVDTLVMAMSKIRKEVPSAKLLVVGDGLERPTLERLRESLGLSQVVRLVGRVERQAVPMWLSASDVAVMPATLRRNLRLGSAALKLREYLACGLPVVASDIPGGGRLLEHEAVGIRAKGDDPEDLARALVRILEDPTSREAMGRRARAFAASDLSWELVASKLLQLFERLCKEAG